jgi:hypothetical protein
MLFGGKPTRSGLGILGNRQPQSTKLALDRIRQKVSGISLGKSNVPALGTSTAPVFLQGAGMFQEGHGMFQEGHGMYQIGHGAKPKPTKPAKQKIVNLSGLSSHHLQSGAGLDFY